MRRSAVLLTMLVAALSLVVPVLAATWERYSIPATGTSVDIPISIFSEKAGKPEGHGQRFRTADGSADLTVQSVPATGESPGQYLARRHPPLHIVYKRVTPHFFVVSSFKRDKIWYDRCNFSARFIHCVLINYPASEKRQWNDTVTRISNTLGGS